MLERKTPAEDEPKQAVHYKSLFDALRVGIVVHAPDTTILLCNPEASRLLGLSQEQMAGKNVDDPAWHFVHEDGSPMLPENYPVNQVLTTLQPLQEYVVGVDGPDPSDRVWVMVDAYPEFAANRDLRNIVVTFVEITNLMQTKEALRKSEEVFEYFMEYSPVYVFFKDEHLRSLMLSRNYETMLGKPRSELLGKSMDELFPPEVAVPMMADDMRIMKEGREFTVEESLNGRIYQTTKFPVLIDGVPRYLAGFTMDITQMKQEEQEKADLQKQLLQSQEMESVGRLAGGVAHDFNNMLMGIMGYAELCLDELPPKHPICGYLQALTETAKRSADLTNKLLAFARKQAVVPATLDLNKVIGGLLEFLQRLIGEHIDLIWIPTPDLWSIHIDPTQVDQILMNLCVNARDAMEGSGSIQIATQNTVLDESFCSSQEGVHPGDYVRLMVQDSGCGIKPADLPQIFEPFFTSKDLGEGTGLGLSTVYGIVKQDNGCIDVQSEAGEGTVFNIYLPRYVANEPRTRDQSKPGMPKGQGETVLLVEDESAIRATCCRFLETLGYTTLVAATPDEARRKAGQYKSRIHLLLTDVAMPGMSGPTLAQHLTASRPDLAVLYMSGYAADAVTDLETESHPGYFIGKPFTRAELAVKMRDVLDST